MSDWRTLLDREIATVGELPKMEKVSFQRPPLYHQTPPQMWAYSFGGNMRKRTLALLLTASSAGFLSRLAPWHRTPRSIARYCRSRNLKRRLSPSSMPETSLRRRLSR